jgi:hypothetical protein
MTGQGPDAGSDKMSISFPRGTRDALKAAVARGAAPNVSALVADAVAERLQRESFHQRIMAARGGRPFDAEAIDWACKALGATPEQTAAMHEKLGAGSSADRAAS